MGSKRTTARTSTRVNELERLSNLHSDLLRQCVKHILDEKVMVSTNLDHIVATGATMAHNAAFPVEGGLWTLPAHPDHYSTHNLRRRKNDQPELEAALRLGAVMDEVVFFATNLPGFQDLSHHDKSALLKTNGFAVCILRFLRHLDSDTHSIVYKDGKIPIEEQLVIDTVDRKLFNTFKSLASTIQNLELCDTEFALYAGYVLIYGNCPDLVSTEDVEAFNITFQIALKSRSAISPDRKSKKVNTHAAVVKALIPLAPQLREMGSFYHEALAQLQIRSPHLMIRFPDTHNVWFMAD